jgi:DNA-binding LytR/AlgR family response regulator
MNRTALIAEDEPLLGAYLQAELAALWPELTVVANVRSGSQAVEQALALRPDVVFLDIKMPGSTGLEAAQALTEDWPDDTALPLLVFVTAYDQYALKAFERAAIDYVLKPVQRDRLALTCARVQSALKARGEKSQAAPGALSTAVESTLEQLRSLLAAPGLNLGSKSSTDANAAGAATPKLRVIQASVGAAIHMVPIADVLYFEAADKYVRVITAGREYLIRTSLRDLLPQLDSQLFWHIHRGTVVRADAVATAIRDESGKVHITLRDHKDKLVASRLYAHLFKAM